MRIYTSRESRSQHKSLLRKAFPYKHLYTQMRVGGEGELAESGDGGERSAWVKADLLAQAEAVDDEAGSERHWYRCAVPMQSRARSSTKSDDEVAVQAR